LTSSAVSPATKKQIGEFQRTSESSSDNPGLRVIARTNTSTRRSSAADATSAETADRGGSDSVAAGADEQHNAASTAMLRAAQCRPIDRLNMPASGTIFPATEIALQASSHQ
jgi:hypothetical protein